MIFDKTEVCGARRRPGDDFFGNGRRNCGLTPVYVLGKQKLDTGKSCVRFRKLDEIALDVIGEAIRRISARRYIVRYQAILAATRKGSGKKAS